MKNTTKDITKEIGEHITDVSCKYCGSERTYHFDVDEIELSYDGTGHYYADYRCVSCGKIFRVYFDFEYKITMARY